MSVALSYPHLDPIDVQENLVRLANSAGLSPAELLRNALDLFAPEWEDRQAAESIRQERRSPLRIAQPAG